MCLVIKKKKKKVRVKFLLVERRNEGKVIGSKNLGRKEPYE